MAQEIKLEAAGLHTNPSDLQRPDGALTIADNIVINREGIIEPRRGFRKYSSSATYEVDDELTKFANQIAPFKNGFVLFRSHSTGLSMAVTGDSITNSTGSLDIVDPNSFGTVKYKSWFSAQFAGSLFFGTDDGVYKLMSLDATQVNPTGIPKPPGEYVHNRWRTITSAIGNMSLTSNIVTVNTTAAHGLAPGDFVFQTSATEAPYAKGFYTVLTTPSTTQFTYALTAGDDAGNANTHTFKIPTYDTRQGWLSPEYQVAYRYVFVGTDANGQEIVSAPSPRIYWPTSGWGEDAFMTSPDDLLAPILELYPPPQFYENDYIGDVLVRIYRSKSVPLAIEPNDEMGLVGEVKFQRQNFSGLVRFKDITPDALRGEALYTNPSQQGIVQENNLPPVMYENSCIVSDGTCLLFGGEITERPSVVVSLLSVADMTDGIKLFGQRITGRTGTPNNDAEFKIETTGTDAQNIRTTALSICSAINADRADLTAYYISGANEAPGKILLVNYYTQSFGEVIARVTSTKHEMFYPPFGGEAAQFNLTRTSNVVTATVTSGTHYFRVGDKIQYGGYYEPVSPSAGWGGGPHTITSVNAANTTFTYSETGTNGSTSGVFAYDTKTPAFSNIRHYARVYESKPFEPEHVPELNYADIGDTTKRVWAMAVVRNQVFAFKEDGLFIRTAPLTWELFDETVRVLAPRTVVTLLNNVYAWTTQGIVAINDTGVEIVSRPIEKTLNDIFLKYPTALKEGAFAVANETERTLYVYVPDLTYGGYPSQAFVYNTITKTWTRQAVFQGATQRAFHAGAVGFDEYSKPHLALVTAEDGNGSLLIQRASYTSADFQDISGPTQTADQGVSTDAAFFSIDPGFISGDTVVTNENTTHIVSIVIESGGVYEVYFTTSDVPLAATTFALQTPISSVWQYAPITGGNPDQLKLFRQANLLFQNAHAKSLTASFSTELKTAFESQTIDIQTIAGQWTTPWDGIERPFNLSILLPQEMRRATRLNAKFTFNTPNQAFSVNGLSIRLSPSGDKVSK